MNKKTGVITNSSIDSIYFCVKEIGQLSKFLHCEKYTIMQINLEIVLHMESVRHQFFFVSQAITISVTNMCERFCEQKRSVAKILR